MGLEFLSTGCVLEAVKAGFPKGLTVPLPDANATKAMLSVAVPLMLMLTDFVVCADAEWTIKSATTKTELCEMGLFMELNRGQRLYNCNAEDVKSR